MEYKQRLFIIVCIVVSIGCLLLFFSKRRGQDVVQIEPKEKIAENQKVKYENLSSKPPEIPEEAFSPPIETIDKDNEIEFLIERLANDDWDVSNKVANKIVSIGKKVIPQLVESLEGASLSLKGRVVFILGRIGDKDAIPALVELLDDENAYIRRNAVESLGKIKDEKAIYELTGTLFDTDISVRERSAWALGELQDPRAVEDLIDRMTDEKEERVKSAVVDALGKLKDDSVTQTLLTELKSDSDQIYKNKIVVALGEIGDSQAISELSEYLDRLKQSEPTEPIVNFQWKQAVRIAEEAIQKIGEEY